MCGGNLFRLFLFFLVSCSFFASIFLLYRNKPFPGYHQTVFMSLILGPATFGLTYFLLREPKPSLFVGCAWYLCLFWWFFLFRGHYFILYPYFWVIDVVRKDSQRKATNLLLELTSPSAPPMVVLLFWLYLVPLLLLLVWVVSSP